MDITPLITIVACFITYKFAIKKYIESIKLDKVFSHVDKIYERISNLSFMAKMAEISFYKNNKDKQEIVDFFDKVRLEIIQIKRDIVLSGIWLPEKLLIAINNSVININKQLDEIYKDPEIIQQDDDIMRSHALFQYFDSFAKILMKQESIVRCAIRDEYGIKTI